MVRHGWFDGGDTGGSTGGDTGGSTGGDTGGSTGGDITTSDVPDFGPSVNIYDENTPSSQIQNDFDTAFDEQLLSPTAQFGAQRDTYLFKPGDYDDLFANIPFYTTVAGLGLNPDDVNINGVLNVDAGWNLGDEGNATQNFWRSAENLSVTPPEGFNRWAVSQAAPMRRLHFRGDLVLNPSNQDINLSQGYASGGFLSDSKVDGNVVSGSQQQWYTQNSEIGGFPEGVWNMVFAGVEGAPATQFPERPYTTLDTTPVSKEKPYLYIQDDGTYDVFVPSLRRDARGVSWPNTPGESIPMSEFFVARPGDSAATMNAALDQGLNLYFTPGVYEIDETIEVDRPGTILTGIGYPSLVPVGGVTPMRVADVGGVNISAILFDAGPTNTPVMLEVGPEGSSADHSADPTTIQDVFVRIGGQLVGRSDVSIVVNSDDVLLDHLWLWRADHAQPGVPTGWDLNTSDTGLIVNGDDVLATGLMVEHYQKYQVIWNGERGRTIFFQNELPYDVPDNGRWQNPNGSRGYAAYKVADSVDDHRLWGGGSYVFFEDNPSVVADRGFEVPVKPGVRLDSIMTVSLGDVGTIVNVVNDSGGIVPIPGANSNPRNVVTFGG